MLPINPPPKPSPVANKSVAKELDISEHVILSMTQFKGHVADDVQLLKMTSKQFTALAGKVDARVVPDFIRLYSKEYSGGSAVIRGMDILEKLSAAQTELALIKELVQCIAPAPDEPPKSAGQFKSALARVRSGGIIVAKVADELVASKHLQEAIAYNN